MAPERLVPGTEPWELYRAEHEQRYDFALSRVRGCRVLDVACGVGYGSAILSDGGAESVTGVDISPETIEYARTHYSESSVEFVAADAQNLPFNDAQFDAAVSFETIEHVPDPVAFVRSVHRVLRAGALFICSTPNADWVRRGENPFHLSEMTYTEFLSTLEPYFDVRETYFQSHSPGYLRYLELLSEIERVAKAQRFSSLLRLESAIRRRLGREPFDMRPLPPGLSRATPGDYVIEPLVRPAREHLTFLVVAHAR